MVERGVLESVANICFVRLVFGKSVDWLETRIEPGTREIFMFHVENFDLANSLGPTSGTVLPQPARFYS